MNITVHIVNLRNILFLERLEKFQEWFKSFGHLIRTWIGPVCAVHVANADHAQVQNKGSKLSTSLDGWIIEEALNMHLPLKNEL